MVDGREHSRVIDARSYVVLTTIKWWLKLGRDWQKDLIWSGSFSSNEVK
jgi:hypothetical protein